MAKVDVVALTEAIVRDKAAQAVYQERLIDEDRDALWAYAKPMIDLVEAGIASAWTATGRGIKVQQVIGVIELLRQKASAAADLGAPGAREQADWCGYLEAVFMTKHRLLKRT